MINVDDSFLYFFIKVVLKLFYYDLLTIVVKTSINMTVFKNITLSKH